MHKLKLSCIFLTNLQLWVAFGIGIFECVCFLCYICLFWFWRTYMEILKKWVKFHFCIDCIHLNSACTECPSLSRKLKFVFMVLLFSIKNATVHKDVLMCGSNINAFLYSCTITCEVLSFKFMLLLGTLD